jgi:hypothetical protein
VKRELCDEAIRRGADLKFQEVCKQR